MQNRSIKGIRSPLGVISALLLVAGCAALAVMSFRVAAAQQIAQSSASVPSFVAHDPNIVLGKAEADLVRLHGILPPATLAAVRTAAARAPLDARAYLVLGHQQLLDRKPERALKTLEAGRRLDPRDRVIHLLLLDRYLRTQRYDAAAAEFGVLSRLVGPAQEPIALGLAQMSTAPATRDAARRTLNTDPVLERWVLVALARSNVPPATVFDLASPTARRNAGEVNSWGPVLVARLVDQKQYAAARTVWQQVHGLPTGQGDKLLYDAGLQRLPGSPPFNWTLAADSLGAADMREGMLSIEYYGRASGNLASQLLVLPRGTYRFRFAVEGKTPPSPALYWSLRCANNDKVELMHAPVKGAGPRRAIIANFTVPAGCPAQRLTLTGEAGEFPVTVSATLRDLDLAAVLGNRP